MKCAVSYKRAYLAACLWHSTLILFRRTSDTLGTLVKFVSSSVNTRPPYICSRSSRPPAPLMPPTCSRGSLTISGYEIHMGATESCTPIFRDDGCIDGARLVIGTYLHGLFGNDNIRHALMSHLHESKGIEYAPQVADS